MDSLRHYSKQLEYLNTIIILNLNANMKTIIETELLKMNLNRLLTIHF